MSSGNKILLLGATGYIGGTVLDHLLRNEEPSIKGLTFDLPVRTQHAVDKLQEAYGSRVKPILWEGFSDTAAVSDLAANYDIVINTGTALIPSGGRALVDGLARRVKPGYAVPWMLHVSGCSNLADLPLTRGSHPERKWDDADDKAVLDYLRSEEEHARYPQRTTEVGVLTTAAKAGVQAVSVNSPCIIGAGTGLFKRESFLIYVIMRYVLQHGYGFKLNETSNFDWVHVEDIAEIYVLLLRTILERDDRGVGYIPSGEHGMMSSGVQNVLLSDIMKLCLDTLFDAGLLPRADTPKEKEIRTVPLKELAEETLWGAMDMAERSWAGHKTMKATKARKLLGWKPTRLEEAWRHEFVYVLDRLKEGKEGYIAEIPIAKSYESQN
ncbi:hypothetical protein F4775DRAFT_577468 [Biscogniauxia sp. FL1348]|nr:hypothetical protein F4775DRAFT_577468 [Biscogniauxia sp. FL1348]